MEDLELYFVGSGSKCIIWNYDIFGFDSGRTRWDRHFLVVRTKYLVECRQTADLFAEAGYLVVIPDFYRGTWKDPTSPGVVEFAKEKTQWSKLKLDLENIILPFAKSKGQQIMNKAECL